MKKTLLTIMGMLSGFVVFSQTMDCDSRMDSMRLMNIAIRHNAWWNNEWYAPPSMKFNADNCEWTVVSYKSKHTDRGDCKNTNGCTMSKMVTLVIDARTFKVKSRKKKITVHPNYE
ncbi:MAG: hypothetical protein V4561_03340 [Bacteroidota bacterium]